jgi:hypothetical protein
MAEQAFGIKEFELIGGGTPTISSPNNLNLNAATVAISTNISIGGTMTVTGGGTFGIGSTVGIGSTLFISHGDLYLRDNHELNINNDALTMRGNNGGNSFITNIIDTSNGSPGDFYISSYSGDTVIESSEHFSVKTDVLGSTDQAILATQNGSVALYHNVVLGGGAGKKLETSTTGVTITGTLAATAVTGDGSGLSNLPAATPSVSDVQVAYELTSNSSSSNGYRISGNAVDSSTPNPDLYLVRGKKYRFINNSGGSHPFIIRVSNGGATYSTGVTNNNASSGNIDFIPNFDAPAQLVYQCSNHGGMVGNIYLRGGNGNEMNVGVTTFSQTPSSASGVTVTSQGLDHYEEGTWTPTLENAGSTTYSTQNGKYTRIGNVVYVTATIIINSHDNSATSVTGFQGLPYPNSSNGQTVVFHIAGNENWDTDLRTNNLTGWLTNGSSTIRIYKNSGNNLNAISVNDIGNNGELFVTGHYFIS